jgi:signal transduction histidine kinase
MKTCRLKLSSYSFKSHQLTRLLRVLSLIRVKDEMFFIIASKSNKVVLFGESHLSRNQKTKSINFAYLLFVVVVLIIFAANLKSNGYNTISNRSISGIFHPHVSKTAISEGGAI